MVSPLQKQKICYLVLLTSFSMTLRPLDLCLNEFKKNKKQKQLFEMPNKCYFVGKELYTDQVMGYVNSVIISSTQLFLMDPNKQPMPTQDQKTAKTAKCFVLNCMDFRLIDDSVYFMDNMGYNNNYDAFVIAGSSLGFTQEKYPHWGLTILDHMSLGQKFHSFEQIIMIDHLQCGAYKAFYPDCKSQQKQIELHKKHMQLAKDRMFKHFPKYPFRGYLMDLDGKCTQIELN